MDSEEEEEKMTPGMTKEEIKKALKGRVFYHSTNIFEKIDSDSLFEESENEINEEPLRELEEKAINDFEDIEESDKQFFIL